MKRTGNGIRTAGHAIAVAAAMASASALGAGPESRMLNCDGETIVLDRAADGSIEGAFGTLRLHIRVREARGTMQPATYAVELLDEAGATGTGTHTGDVSRIWDAACGLIHDHVERLSRPDVGALAERLAQAYEELAEDGGKP